MIDWFNPPSEKLPHGDDFRVGPKSDRTPHDKTVLYCTINSFRDISCINQTQKINAALFRIQKNRSLWLCSTVLSRYVESLHSGIIPVGQFSRKCAKSINQAQTFIVNLYNHFDLIGLLDSHHTICFYGGGAKVTQNNGIIQHITRRHHALHTFDPSFVWFVAQLLENKPVRWRFSRAVRTGSIFCHNNPSATKNKYWPILFLISTGNLVGKRSLIRP